MRKKTIIAALLFVLLFGSDHAQPDDVDLGTECKGLQLNGGNRFALNETALQLFDNDVQRFLDCCPPNSTVDFSLPQLRLDGILEIAKPVTVIGGGVSIKCYIGNKKQGAFIIRSDDVTIGGLSFQGCSLNSTAGLIQIENSENVRLHDLHFSDNKNAAGAPCMSLVESTVLMKNLTAVGNGGVFGGVMSITSSSMQIQDSEFLGNEAMEQGGALYLQDSNLNASDVRFIGNSALDDGGAVFAEGYVGSTVVGMVGASIHGNRVYGDYKDDLNWHGGGGLAFVGSGLRVEIMGTSFVNNSASNVGGSVSIMNGTSMFIAASRFIRNRSFQAGAIYVESALPNVTYLKVEDTKFQSNYAVSQEAFGSFQPFGGAIALFENGTSATFKNITFSRNRAGASGGALLCSRIKALSISSSKLLTNTAACPGKEATGEQQDAERPVWKPLDGEKCDASGSLKTGGAVYIDGTSKIFVEGSLFHRNSAQAGGAVEILNSAAENVVAEISGSTFVENGATVEGGALFVAGPDLKLAVGNTTFENNRAGARGGAIAGVTLTQVQVSLSKFLGNAAGKGVLGGPISSEGVDPSGDLTFGGALSLHSVGDVSIVNSNLTGSMANRGGAIFIDSVDLKKATLEIRGAMFEENISSGNASLSDGAAMALFGGGLECSVENTVFQRNEAESQGGAIFSLQIAGVKLSQASFLENWSGAGGGALLMEGSSLAVTRSKFVGNAVKNDRFEVRFGGAAYLFAVTSVAIEESTFVHNQAPNGGAVALSAGDLEGSVAEITSSTFRANSAWDAGGALHLTGKGLKLDSRSSTFKGNNAGVAGGAVNAANITELTVTDSSFTTNMCGAPQVAGVGMAGILAGTPNNSADPEGYVFGFQSELGGAILMSGRNSRLDVNSSNFTENRASQRHQEGSGAAIASQNGVIAQIVDSTFSRNEASLEGGGIFSGNSELTINGGWFEGNIADANGGAISAKGEGARLDLTGARFTDNSLGWGVGGAISLQEGALATVLDAKFFNNTTPLSGGAVYSAGSECRIQGGTFEENRASEKGGGIFAQGPFELFDVTSVLFASNKAPHGGGIFVDGGIGVNVSSCEFTSNEAQWGGGGIAVQRWDLDKILTLAVVSPEVKITECTFSKNKAGDFVLSSIGPAIMGLEEGRGGAVMMLGQGVFVKVDECIFHENTAGAGGSIYLEDVWEMNLFSSTFTSGRALKGGALTLQNAKSAFMGIGLQFLGNIAREGGAVSLTQTEGNFFLHWVDGSFGAATPSHHFAETHFAENIALVGGGAVDARGVAFYCNTCVFRSNHARNDRSSTGGNGGGIRAHVDGIVACSHCVIDGCSAQNAGGGVYLQDSMFDALNATVVNNVAVGDGGGVASHFTRSYTNPRHFSFPQKYVWSCESCTFDDNSGRSGGGIHIVVESTPLACGNVNNGAVIEDGTCEPESVTRVGKHPISINDTTVTNNSPHGIFFNDLSVVKFCCKEDCFLGRQLKNIPEDCGDPGGASVSLGTSMKAASLVPSKLDGQVSSQTLSPITIQILDIFDNLLEENVTLKMQSVSPGVELFGNPVVKDGVLMSGSFVATGIVLRALPGKYNISFELVPKTVGSQRILKYITVVVRKCAVGEISRDSGKRCEKCKAGFFSFSIGDEECHLCPRSKAKCGGSVLVPMDGFWHFDHRSIQVHECLSMEACTRENRTMLLEEASAAFGESAAGALSPQRDYPQCAEGYEDILCGSCASTHGKVRSFNCVKCVRQRAGIFIGAVIVALLLVSLVYVKSAAKFSEEVMGGANVSTRNQAMPSTPPRQRPFNVQALVLGEVRIQERPIQRAATRRRAADVFKILVNFFQVTGSSAAISTNWTKSMLSVLTSLGVMSGVADGNNLFAMECAFSPGGLSRSIEASILLVFLPVVVWMSFAIFYGCCTWNQQSAFHQWWLLSFVALLAVLNASYISVTRILVRIFYCVSAAPAEGLFWVEDTSVLCYHGAHALLVALLGAPFLLLVSFGFPAWLLFVLKRNKLRLTDKHVVTRYGFFYRAYKEETAAWEVAILARKALLAIIVVFDRPLGKEVQGNMAIFVMLVSLVLHMKFLPFVDQKLNHMELASLVISTLAFITANVVDEREVTRVSRAILSVFFIGVVVVFVSFIVLELLKAALVDLRQWIEKAGPGVSLPSTTWEVIKRVVQILGDQLQAKKRFKRFKTQARRWIVEYRTGSKRGA